MRVKPKEEILFKGTWYKPGQELPKEYIEENKPKKEVKNASDT